MDKTSKYQLRFSSHYCDFAQLIKFCLLASVCLSINSVFSEEQIEPSRSVDVGIVQVLAYKADDLINQISGVVVSDSGVVVTHDHIFKGSTKILIKTNKGEEYIATPIDSNIDNDLLLLKTKYIGKAVKFSIDELDENDSLKVLGFWNKQEEKRRSFFGISSKPAFKATEISKLNSSKAVASIQENTSTVTSLITVVGRGSYGAGVVNQCDEFAGIVIPAPNRDQNKLWDLHQPVGAKVLKSSYLKEQLVKSDVKYISTKNTCLNVQEIIEQKKKEKEKQQEEIKQVELEAAKEKEAAEEAKKEAEQSKKQAEEAKKEAEQSKKQAEESKKEAEEAKKEAEESKKEAEELEEVTQKTVEDKQDIVDMATQVVQEAEDLKGKVTKDNELLTYAIAGSVLLGLIIVFLLLLKRKRDLNSANVEIEKAKAAFPDCQFEGYDSSKSPIAFVVLGRDLLQRDEGLLLGRNPDESQVVIADETVSRVHARLFVHEGYLYIEDLGSSLGTKINGQSLTGTAEGAITDDEITFGEVVLKLTIM